MSTFQFPDIHSTVDGFSKIAEIYHRAVGAKERTVMLSLGNTRWIDANMCAPLGAMLYKLLEKKDVTIRQPSSRLGDILSRNGFWREFGGASKPDFANTTIAFRRFELLEEDRFQEYLDLNWRGKGIPKMTPALRRALLGNIGEVFNNAATHSHSQAGVFSCGQYFPTKKRLSFCIADVGVGIRTNVERFTGKSWDPVRAIEWALVGRNTTRTGNIPGGLGLKVLREFIQKNKGKIQIVSDGGYWEEEDGVSRTALLPRPFPGTIVNLEVNTADKHSYKLKSEVSIKDLF